MSSVIVGVSGGVDSSVALHILKEQGFKVEGVIFKQVNAACPSDDSLCCSASAIEEALAVCRELGIRLNIRDLRRLFREKVVDPTNAEMRTGIVPSPCTTCNSEVRSIELDRTRELLSFNLFATGHYFRTESGKVFRGLDLKKDQSYMVALVKKEFFERWITPLGSMLKSEVRSIADDLNLITAHNPDSQDLCFKHLLPMITRKIHLEGRIVGEKTCRTPSVGQKKGYGGLKVLKVNEESIFLTSKNIEKMSSLISKINWIVDEKPEVMDIQLHSHSSTLKGRVRGEVLELDRPAILAPGQVAAFYNGDQLLGGAVIRHG